VLKTLLISFASDMAIRRVIRKQLGELLIERGVISRGQLDKALAFQQENGGLIGDILVQLGFAKEEDIALALTAQYGFPYLPLGNYDIDPETVKMIPLRVALQYLLIPIDKIGNSLSIAISNPLNVQAIEDVELISGSSVQIFVSTSSDIKKAIERYYKEKNQ
jgi:type IV pilus assembly protein PilB